MPAGAIRGNRPPALNRYPSGLPFTIAHRQAGTGHAAVFAGLAVLERHGLPPVPAGLLEHSQHRPAVAETRLLANMSCMNIHEDRPRERPIMPLSARIPDETVAWFLGAACLGCRVATLTSLR